MIDTAPTLAQKKKLNRSALGNVQNKRRIVNIINVMAL